jgi:predicted RND superfamily exporter protein
MSAGHEQSTVDDQPVVARLEDFDTHSGWKLEQLLFNHRGIVVGVCLAMTLIFALSAAKLHLNASFEKTIPTHHPYIVNYLKHKQDLGALGNSVRFTVETRNGTIYDQKYLATLQKISDELFMMQGVDRVFMKSLWTPSAQWRAVTDEGFEAGPIMPTRYDGSPESIAQVKRNVEMSGEVGSLVARNEKSSVIFVPLLAADDNGKPLDYGKMSKQFEALRDKYQNDGIVIHITGFAKVLGDLIGGLSWFLLFFAMAIIVDAVFLIYYIRCWRATFVVIGCSLIAVVWQLGILSLLHLDLNPYSILVPFLIFSIGTSHGSQKMNGILQDIGRGTNQVVAARYTFRRLFVAGLTALLADAVGFAVLSLIRIPVIQELALTASIGVVLLIVTNLILVPIVLSYVGVSPSAAKRSLQTELAEKSGGKKNPVWQFLDLFTQKKWAAVAIAVAVVMTAGGLVMARDLKIGDLDPGAPELRPSSRYNQDNAYLNANYGASSDVLAVMVETPDQACSNFETVRRLDNLEWKLRQLAGVESTTSLAMATRFGFTGYSEGSMKWFDIPRNQNMINTITANSPRGLYNENCNLLVLSVFLKDHKADTLDRVVKAVQDFSDKNSTQEAKFVLGAGTSGIDAATNIVVKKASRDMLYYVYAAVLLLSLITFRSVRAVIVAVLPLMMTSVLCDAIMAKMGMGVKVATLPVVALGVGIGIDYALYMLSVTLSHMRHGESLSRAYYATLCFTGRVVLFTGITLGIGVATWSFSPIKFQADTGILLSFMFIWNMVGALILLPSLAVFLLPKDFTKTSESIPAKCQPDQSTQDPSILAESSHAVAQFGLHGS